MSSSLENAMSSSDSSTIGATASPASSLSTESTSGHLVVFEAIAVVLFLVSFYWMRRRRRQLEMRTEQRYERLSRVELGNMEPPQTPPPQAPSSPGP